MDTRSEGTWQDPHRPTYHFLPPANWLNDPNGLIQWTGEYHLFYQYNPNGPFHGTIHWGHAVSPDLVHWRDLPIALAPTPGGPDKDGCFSGCAVNNNGVPTLVYTGISPEVQCVATSADDLLTWQKNPDNPVIAAPPPGLDVVGFRDPYVWREADAWYCVIGSGIRGAGGTIFLYRSPDLVHWTYLHQLCSGDPAETGTMWECPNFFPLGDKHVLLISPIPLRKVLALIGTYRDHRFIPERIQPVDDGGCFYAPQVLRDDSGRALMWGWLWENRPLEASRAAGWNGVMSLPRVLSLGPDGALNQRPAPELEALRGERSAFARRELPPGHSQVVDGISGDAFEIEATFELATASAVSLAVRYSPDGAHQTRIVYDRPRGYLSIDRSRSSQAPSVEADVRGCPLVLGPGEPLQLHVFLDRSVLEVFANDRVCLSSRIYPIDNGSIQIQVASEGAPARVHSLTAWTMPSIWPG
jgi:beta-fructofuranosidase